MREFGREFCLVVLDDGSTDDTAETLGRYTKTLPLTVLREETPLGYGAAVDRLLRHVVKVCDYPKRDAVVVLQGDLTDDPADLVDLTKALEGGADIVAGLAEPPEESADRGLRWGRRLAPLVMGQAYRRCPVSDPLCGLRAYRIIVLKKALRDSDAPFTSAPEPWVSNVELLNRLIPHARRVETMVLRLRHHLLTRETRFQTVPVLKRLFKLRSTRWPDDVQVAHREREGEQVA